MKSRRKIDLNENDNQLDMLLASVRLPSKKKLVPAEPILQEVERNSLNPKKPSI
jgi:hypothetical protein